MNSNYRHRSSNWIAKKKQSHKTVTNPDWWQQYVNQYRIIRSVLESNHVASDQMSLDLLFDINHNFEMVVDEQILCYLHEPHSFDLNAEIDEYLKYNDTNLLRRIKRCHSKLRLPNYFLSLAINIAGKLRLVFHNDTTSYKLPNSKYKAIFSALRHLTGRTKSGKLCKQE
eukprot:515530_1